MIEHMKACPEDIALWPCGTWCYREALYEYNYMSDDFRILERGTSEYAAFLMEELTH